MNHESTRAKMVLLLVCIVVAFELLSPAQALFTKAGSHSHAYGQCHGATDWEAVVKCIVRTQQSTCRGDIYECTVCVCARARERERGVGWGWVVRVWGVTPRMRWRKVWVERCCCFLMCALFRRCCVCV